MRNDETGKLIKENVQKLIDLNIIRTEKDLKNPTLDMIEQISNELNICIKKIICCYCPHESCIGNKESCR